ncbi:MmgE/PrpD family protein [Acinetobacter sp. ANC 4945]|uniref:2-methylcitrate dehydratase n=1 Tax=Acinetobacter amyesii TaxID=2942470 RepID=A0A1T1GU49_9GAMM|nr:MmgE/PrpD family protein [Acinetobacter amyesii]MCL6247925.1 MmgE/PrpD family protein [Acinetobacter amyesii]OOV81142.1 2-methylcitrate dehydratase [Acinetobacter amyesii]
MTTLIQKYAEYAALEAQRDLNTETLHHAKRVVLDWFSALYPGFVSEVGENIVATFEEECGIGKSRIPSLNKNAFSSTAAWVMGTTSHAVEFDDIFRDAVYHPGVPVISAALAVADEYQRSGLEFLKAVVVGYEVSTRLGAAVQPSHYKYFHTTGTVGAIGSAAAAAFLINPNDKNIFSHAVATATTFASGLQQAFRSDAMTKALHGGHAASIGVTAAKAAAKGITGALDILEGEVGFGAALSKDPKWEKATLNLGTDYNVCKMTQKNHGCCGHTFAAIDGVLEIRSQILNQNLNLEDVENITVRTYQTALDVTGNFNPESAFQCRFSLPYVVSHGFLHGSVRLNAFIDEQMASIETRELMKKLILESDDELTSKFPNQRAAKVKLTLKNGQSFEHFSPCRKGDPEAPLSDEELDNKFYELVEGVLTTSHAKELRDQIWNLENIRVADLTL